MEQYGQESQGAPQTDWIPSAKKPNDIPAMRLDSVASLTEWNRMRYYR
ncbi:MAG: hypothetical protein AB7C91_13770 [Sphaerochaeta sp.]